MIRAAALSYAIVFSLLIGLICSGILFLASVQKRVEVIHNTKERVLFDSYAAIQYGLHQLQPGDSATVFHKNGDTSKVFHRQWGAFSLIVSNTHHAPYVKVRSALVGGRQSPKLPCFYLPGTTNGLKITGKTRIEGKALVPLGEIERGYIAGKNYEYDKLVFGEIGKSETTLPPLKSFWSTITAQSFAKDLLPLVYIPRDSSYSFERQTTYYQSLAPIVVNNRLKGNVIIHSFDSIYVEARANLSNVVLIAPVVRFEKGFKGVVQVIAHEHIYCEEGVQLLYPSICVLNELKERNETNRRFIHLAKESVVTGGILITSQAADFRKLPLLELTESAVVAGLIYVSGEAEIRGSVIGSLYVNQLITRAGGGVYGNHLVDALISSQRLPDYFLLPCWLEEQKTVQSKVISWL